MKNQDIKKVYNEGKVLMSREKIKLLHFRLCTFLPIGEITYEIHIWMHPTILYIQLMMKCLTQQLASFKIFFNV